MAAEISVGVGVFIFKDGKFLMGKRRGSHGLNTWSVPGGHVEFGETFETTAKREVMEETGLTIKNVRFGAITNNIFPDEKDKHTISIWMMSDYVSGVPTILEPDKYTDQSWSSFNKLPKPLFLPWDELLKSEFIDKIREECSLT